MVPDRFDDRARSYTPARVGLYNEANRDHPEVRETERQLLISRLDLEPGMVVCDVGAGGGYLAEGIDLALDGDVRVVCVENSESFLATIDDRFDKVLSSLGQIDLPADSADRICSLAGLHHQENKADFFAEAFRILKPCGRLVVADVLAGSPPALFLNDAVDRFTDIGHDGMFVEHSEMRTLIAGAGFEHAEEQYERYTWDLPSRADLTSFCRTLFRMNAASLAEVEAEIDRHLDVSESATGVHLHWSLIYASGVRASSPVDAV